MTINENFDAKLFNGEPSIILDERPFFSISVACYNGGKVIPRLLDSIIAQDMNEEIEVVLVDDHSTESYDDVVEQYKDKLCLRRVQTDYNCCPGNTREKGMQSVRGIWGIMSDQDDGFIPGTLQNVKNIILKYNIPYMLTCGFYEVDGEAGGYWKDHIIRKMTNRYGWTHGKVFNMDNFWNKFGVHFKKDMKSHEDIYISSYIQCVFEFLGTSPMVTDEPFYIWFKHHGSLTMIDYLYDGKPHFFLEVLFKDYIASTAGVFLDQFEIGNISYDSFRESMLSCTLYIYFYMQSFMFHHPDDWIKENIEFARKDLLAFKRASKLTNDDIYNLVQMDDAKLYKEVSNSADMGTGNYIPTYSFREWLDILSPEGEKLFLIKEEN